MEKNTGKIREKSGNFVRGKKWEPWSISMEKNNVKCSFIRKRLCINVM